MSENNPHLIADRAFAADTLASYQTSTTSEISNQTRLWRDPSRVNFHPPQVLEVKEQPGLSQRVAKCNEGGGKFERRAASGEGSFFFCVSSTFLVVFFTLLDFISLFPVSLKRSNRPLEDQHVVSEKIKHKSIHGICFAWLCCTRPPERSRELQALVC